jgi:hypothetical protein
MNCAWVQKRLAGYLDDALASHAGANERIEVRGHLESCAECREVLDSYHKLAILLARAPKSVPPRDLAVRIRVAAAQAQPDQERFGRWRRLRDRAEILLDNVFGPLSVPATGGFFSAILVFALVLQVIAPGITVQAVPNDVPLSILQPAQLLSLSDYPESWAPEEHETDLAIPHGLLLDVTVDAHGQMVDYQILSGPRSPQLSRQLDQMLLFSRFRPMMSFGRPTSGGHVVLSFSAVRVRG